MRTPVVVQGRSAVECSEPMMAPCWSSIRALVHHYKSPRGMKGIGSEVQVFAVDAGVCGKVGVEFGEA